MSATSTFKIGDMVVVRTGGPAMTIQTLHGVNDCWATCVWFDETKHKTGEFRVETLERLKEPRRQTGNFYIRS